MIKTTIVINVYGAPNAGKSGLACGIRYFLSLHGQKNEYVDEWLKKWIMQGKKITAKDDYMIIAKQMQEEATFYNKTKFLVTDCPLYLCAYYAEKRNCHNLHFEIIKNFVKDQEDKNAIKLINIYLKRNKKLEYVAKDRIHSDEESLKIEEEMLSWLKGHDQKIDFILENNELDTVKHTVEQILKFKD